MHNINCCSAVQWNVTSAKNMLLYRMAQIPKTMKAVVVYGKGESERHQQT